MPSNPERFKVCHLGRKVTVSPYIRQTDGVASWRFGYKDPSGNWRYITRMTREEARQAALEKLEELHPDGIEWSNLPGDEKEFFSGLHRLGLSSDDRDAVLRFAADRINLHMKIASLQDELRELRSLSEGASTDIPVH